MVFLEGRDVLRPDEANGVGEAVRRLVHLYGGRAVERTEGPIGVVGHE
jgi:hypothetical protein